MSSERLPCLGPGSSGELRTWSEDPHTARARAVWTAGDFRPIARSYAPGAAAFVDRLPIGPGTTVLDVASGTGNLSIPAARRGARVTGIDLAPNLVAVARADAAALGLAVAFDVGDAEALGCPDGRFQVTMSMFGAMFTPRPDRAAREMARVTASGGTIAMANWTPDGFVGRMLRAHTAVAPPPVGAPSPLGWGREDVARARFDGLVRSFAARVRPIELRFPLPPAAVTELFATHYGPTVLTLQSADPAGASQLRAELTALFTENNIAPGGTTAVVSEYLEIHAIAA